MGCSYNERDLSINDKSNCEGGATVESRWMGHVHERVVLGKTARQKWAGRRRSTSDSTPEHRRGRRERETIRRLLPYSRRVLSTHEVVLVERCAGVSLMNCLGLGIEEEGQVEGMVWYNR
jgi:hypothetical protein